MTPISTRIVARTTLVALSICLSISFCALLGAHSTTARAQAGNTGKAEKPVYHDYKGVQIDMGQDEARKKLGDPKDKSDEQDFYLFSDNESAQIFYQGKKVFAVSVTYLGTKASAPEAKSVLGTEIEPAADGRLYKLIRYKDAGFWVSYNRISGDEPMVTVTMQKLQ